MRPLRALAIYILVVFLGGALLAPWLYWLVQHFAHTFPNLANAPFHRYVNRALLGLALLGLWPLAKSLRMTSLRDLGLVSPSGQWKRLGAGFLLGFLSLAVVAAFAFALHARQLNPKLSGVRLGERLFSAAGTAVIIAILEEILFRGALFGAFRKVLHWVFALAVTSMIYAILHFLESPKDPGTVNWLSGLQLLPPMFANFANWQIVIPGFLNLTLAGVLLGWAYQRTGNLYFSVGLHSAWIFWVKAYAAVSSLTPGANAWWWGTGRMAVVNGWMAFPVLVATLLIFGWNKETMKKSSKHRTPSSREMPGFKSQSAGESHLRS